MRRDVASHAGVRVFEPGASLRSPTRLQVGTMLDDGPGEGTHHVGILLQDRDLDAGNFDG